MKRFKEINIVAVFIVVICVVMIITTRLPQEVREVVTHGVRASVEDVQLDGNKCTVKVNLKKEDGTTFSDEERIGELHVSLQPSQLSTQKDISLSSDKKVLTYTIIARPKREDKIRNIEIQMDSLIREYEGREILEESIYDLYNEYPLQYAIEDTKESDNYIGDIKEVQVLLPSNEIQGLIPISEVNNFSIIGVGFNDGYDREAVVGKTKKELLHIQTRLIEHSISSTASIYSLYNEVTKEEVGWIQGSSCAQSNDNEGEPNITIGENYYELTNTDKLKHIKPIVEYTKRDIINQGKWILQVNVDNSRS